MAIIGKINKLESFFAQLCLMEAFNYFLRALDQNSQVNKRIFSLPVGAFERVDLTEDIFALEQVFYTKDRSDCFIESHVKYIDFQLVLEGSEQMEYVDTDKLIVKTAYDEEKDLVVYEDSDKTSKLVMERGDIAIFSPCDAHIGMPKFKRSELVYKTVLKIPVESVKGM